MDSKIIDGKYVFEIEGLTFATPAIPDKKLIYGYDLKKADQKWKRIPFPENFESISSEERIQIISEDIGRRLNGFWFYNNGTPTYLTGDHFFYLNYWWMGALSKDGFPDYKASDQTWFYHWEVCQTDPDCFGQIYLTQRRDGKSEKAIACIYNKTSLFENKLSGLQAKTERDAKDNLFMRIIRSWQKLPESTKPVDEGIDEPKKALRFYAPSKRSTKQTKRVAKKALKSRIDFGATKASHYQGKELFRILLDEPATIDEMDLIDWFSTVKKCLGKGRFIVGKMLLPATIENMKLKGGEPYRNIYAQSDQGNKNANNRTQSGLYRLFKPAYIGYEGFIDEYGNDILTPEGEYAAKIYLQNERDSATPEELSKLKRQFPFTVDEAFDVVASDVWEEDVKEILKAVRQQLLNEQPAMLNVTLFELGGQIQMAECKADKEGVVRIFEKPVAGVKYKVGFDGTGSDKETGDEQGSKVAIVVLKSFEGPEKLNYLPVCTFSLRPDKMEQAYQIIYLVCRYYGMHGELKILGESNAGQAPAVVAYFGNRGGASMLMKKPKNPGMKYNETSDKYWIYRNEPVKDMQKYLANVFIRRYGHNIKHINLINDLIDLGKRNVDEADAFLMAVLAMGDFDKTMDQKQKAKRPRQYLVFKTGPGGVVTQEWVTEGQTADNKLQWNK